MVLFKLQIQNNVYNQARESERERDKQTSKQEKEGENEERWQVLPRDNYITWEYTITIFEAVEKL